MPFDRLIEGVDDIAAKHTDVKFIVQALNSTYNVKNIEVINFLSSVDFDNAINNAKLIISHAGMGTIITALVKKIPIIVMPRLVKFNEHRNDHQLGTAKQMDAGGYVYVAYDTDELKKKFDEMWPDKLNIRNVISNEASQEMIQSLNNYIKF